MSEWLMKEHLVNSGMLSKKSLINKWCLAVNSWARGLGLQWVTPPVHPERYSYPGMGISMAAFLFSSDGSFLGISLSIFSLSVTSCLIYLQSWVAASLPSAFWVLRYSFISHSFFINSWFSGSYTISEILREQEDSNGKVTQFAIGKPQSIVCVLLCD